MKTTVGLNCDVCLRTTKKRQKLELWRAYADAVELAGGTPLLLPATESSEQIKSQLDVVDRLVLVGGDDYDPALFGAAKHPRTELLHPARQRYDVELARAAMRRNIPILAICGGLQLINVVCGGDLIQHLPDAAPGGASHGGCAEGVAHEVIIEHGSRLESIVGGLRLGVNSTHHQAVGRVGKGLRVVARSVDGVIEALEREGGGFLVCVQWHPERLTARPEHLALFKALVKA